MRAGQPWRRPTPGGFGGPAQRPRDEHLLHADEELVAGRRPVEEAFVARRPAHRLLVVPQRRLALERLVLHATNLRIPVVEVEGGTLTAIAGFDGHQGIALAVEPRTYAGLDDVLARAAERREPPFVLVLDSLEDPQNVGTLLRSAEAAGVHGVIYPTHRQAPLTPAAVKASAGAVEHLLLCPVEDLPGALSDLRIRGLRIAAAEAEAALTASDADLRGPLAIIVGSEGQGLSPAVRRRADLAIRIPMRGQIGSLNAAVAGSVLLFAAVAQRDPTGATGNQLAGGIGDKSESPIAGQAAAEAADNSESAIAGEPATRETGAAASRETSGVAGRASARVGAQPRSRMAKAKTAAAAAGDTPARKGSRSETAKPKSRNSAVTVDDVDGEADPVATDPAPKAPRSTAALPAVATAAEVDPVAEVPAPIPRASRTLKAAAATVADTALRKPRRSRAAPIAAAPSTSSSAEPETSSVAASEPAVASTKKTRRARKPTAAERDEAAAGSPGSLVDDELLPGAPPADASPRAVGGDRKDSSEGSGRA